MENGGVFFVKKWTFPRRRVHYVQYQYFFILHCTYLGEGCVHTQRTPSPCPQACVMCRRYGVEPASDYCCDHYRRTYCLSTAVPRPDAAAADAAGGGGNTTTALPPWQPPWQPPPSHDDDANSRPMHAAVSVVGTRAEYDRMRLFDLITDSFEHINNNNNK